ncbi:MAG: hypothetical protein JSV53_09685 [candidate division WOR-3 bacterium]|nr:MAG: hypothetical protein JSV53_09685 [candidate division WOR-3 bacterium]
MAIVVAASVLWCFKSDGYVLIPRISDLLSSTVVFQYDVTGFVSIIIELELEKVFNLMVINGC